jgi:hypothetical protein
MWIRNGMSLSMANRHFIGGNYPLFREPKNYDGFWQGNGRYPYTESIYYYWFEFLKLSEKYKKACSNNGKGMQRIYTDFGDIFSYKNFKSWWVEVPLVTWKPDVHMDNLMNSRGALLFSEPASNTGISLVKPSELDKFKGGWSHDDMLMIAVPLHFKKSYIQKEVNKLLNENGPKRGRGERNFRESKAKYPIANQFKLEAIKNAFNYYNLRNQYPDDKLYELYDRVNNRRNEFNQMNVAVSRAIKYAKNLIEGAEKGIFPHGQRTK